MNTRLSLVVAGVSVGLALAGSALSQLKPKTITAAQLKSKTVVLAPSVQQALAGKAVYDASKVLQSLSYVGKIPVLKLNSGRQVKLEPVDGVEPQPNAQLKATAAALDPALTRYRTYIDAPFVASQRPAELSKLVGTIISHKSRQTPIKDQGSRNTCVGFAATAGLESFLKWKYNETTDLSEQHVFELLMAGESNQSCNNQGLATWKAAEYLTDRRACDNWAYAPNVPACSLTVPTACANAAKYGYTSTQVLFGTEFGGSGVQTANNTNYLESLLQAGNDLIFGVYVAGSDWSSGTLDSGVVDVQMVGSSPAPAYAGHAMLLVGYNRAANYFEFKNSWGTGSGHSGYVRLSYEYVQAYGKYGYYIKSVARPLTLVKAGKTPTKKPIRQRLPRAIKK